MHWVHEDDVDVLLDTCLNKCSYRFLNHHENVRLEFKNGILH